MSLDHTTIQTTTAPDPSAGHCSTEDYRDLMCSFPTGVSVVTAADEDGRPWGLTCSSLSSVTLAPPTLLVCLASRSPVLAVARASGRFAVNLLHARAHATARLFATPGADRFARTAWQAADGSGLPHLLDDAFAAADCHVVAELPVGDHTVLFGEVARISRGADLPLLYGLRRFAAWPLPVDP